MASPSASAGADADANALVPARLKQAIKGLQERWLKALREEEEESEAAVSVDNLRQLLAGHEQQMQELQQQGAGGSLVAKWDEPTLQLLAWLAVSAGHLEAVRFLVHEKGLKQDAGPNMTVLAAVVCPQLVPWGLLGHAIGEEHEAMAELLAEGLESVAGKDDCLGQAVLCGYADVARLLIQRHGAKWHVAYGQDGHKLICGAATWGHHDVLKVLFEEYRRRGLGSVVLERPCRAGEKKAGYPLLFHAIHNGDHVETVACLVDELGADPQSVMSFELEIKGLAEGNKRMVDAVPFLHAAALACRLETLRYLIRQKGLDANSTMAKSDLTPLHFACMAQRVKPGEEEAEELLPVVRFLVEEGGALPGARDSLGQTPADQALQHGFQAVHAYLSSLPSSGPAPSSPSPAPVVASAGRAVLYIDGHGGVWLNGWVDSSNLVSWLGSLTCTKSKPYYYRQQTTPCRTGSSPGSLTRRRSYVGWWRRRSSSSRTTGPPPQAASPSAASRTSPSPCATRAAPGTRRRRQRRCCGSWWRSGASLSTRP
jgi:hypothetical protein